MVKGVFESAGQLQIIIGGGTVNKVYNEFIVLADKRFFHNRLKWSMRSANRDESETFR